MNKGAHRHDVWAVEIHDLDERNVVAFDLPEFDTLGDRVFALEWIVADYDPVTEDATVGRLRKKGVRRSERDAAERGAHFKP